MKKTYQIIEKKIDENKNFGSNNQRSYYGINKFKVKGRNNRSVFICLFCYSFSMRKETDRPFDK